jgi:hypothetical protein
VKNSVWTVVLIDDEMDELSRMVFLSKNSRLVVFPISKMFKRSVSELHRGRRYFFKQNSGFESAGGGDPCSAYQINNSIDAKLQVGQATRRT